MALMSTTKCYARHLRLFPGKGKLNLPDVSQYSGGSFGIKEWHRSCHKPPSRRFSPGKRKSAPPTTLPAVRWLFLELADGPLEAPKQPRPTLGRWFPRGKKIAPLGSVAALLELADGPHVAPQLPRPTAQCFPRTRKMCTSARRTGQMNGPDGASAIAPPSR